MYSVQCLFILLILALFSSVQSYKMCNLTDTVCMTNGAKNLWKSLVVSEEPVDPLHVDEISGKTENIAFRMSDITLRGFKNCEATYLIANKAETTYEHRFRCPELILNYNYEVTGKLGTFEIDGKSSANLTATDYEIISNAIYGIRISVKDNIPHFFTKSFDIQTNAGNLFFETDKLVNAKGEDITERVSTLVNENWETYKEYIRKPIIMKFMTIIMGRFDVKLSTLSPSEAFPQKD